MKKFILSVSLISGILGLAHNAGAEITFNQFSEAGRYCREYTQRVKVGNKFVESYGTACLQPDGSWQAIKHNDQPAITPVHTIVEAQPRIIYTPYYPPVIRTNLIIDYPRHNWHSRYHNRYNDRHRHHYDNRHGNNHHWRGNHGWR